MKMQNKNKLDDWQKIRIEIDGFEDKRNLVGILADNGFTVTTEVEHHEPPLERKGSKLGKYWSHYVVVEKKEVGEGG